MYIYNSFHLTKCNEKARFQRLIRLCWVDSYTEIIIYDRCKTIRHISTIV